MGTIALHQSVKQVHILDARQWERRPPILTSTWTKIRLAAYLGITTTAAENAAIWTTVATDITESNSGAADLLIFGMKDASTTAMPGEAGCEFWGVCNPAGVSTRLFADGSSGNLVTVEGSEGISASRLQFTVASGTTRNDVESSDAASGNHSFPCGVQTSGAGAGATNYAGFFCLEIELVDRGLSTQNVIFRVSRSQSVTVDPVNFRSQLATAMGTFASPFVHAGSVAANDGATAFPVSTKFVIRAPFNNYRWKIYAKRVVQIA